MQFHTSISSLAARSDAFIIDVWGVIMDGRTLYPGARHALEQLYQEGKQIVLLSNVPQRAERLSQKLKQIGLSPELFSAVFTSGEICYLELQERLTTTLAGHTTPTYFEIGDYEGESALIQDLAYRKTEDIRQASFILALSLDGSERKMAEYYALLDQAHILEIPFICVNPDKLAPMVAGNPPAYCPGMLAEYYLQKGGVVLNYGKPFMPVYEACLRRIPHQKSQILAIGDTFHTDILGAHYAGIDAALITGGVLANTLGPHHENPEKIMPHLQSLEAIHQCSPTYILPYLQW
jgi:HAD superfamily hydrolase (TIGR01459 family)